MQTQYGCTSNNFDLSTGQLSEEFRWNLVLVGAELVAWGVRLDVLWPGIRIWCFHDGKVACKLHIFPMSVFLIINVFPPLLEKNRAASPPESRTHPFNTGRRYTPRFIWPTRKPNIASIFTPAAQCYNSYFRLMCFSFLTPINKCIPVLLDQVREQNCVGIRNSSHNMRQLSKGYTRGVQISKEYTRGADVIWVIWRLFV